MHNFYCNKNKNYLGTLKINTRYYCKTKKFFNIIIIIIISKLIKMSRTKQLTYIMNFNHVKLYHLYLFCTSKFRYDNSTYYSLYLSGIHFGYFSMEATVFVFHCFLIDLKHDCWCILYILLITITWMVLLFFYLSNWVKVKK